MKSKELEHDGVNVPVNLSDIHLDPEDNYGMWFT